MRQTITHQKPSYGAELFSRIAPALRHNLLPGIILQIIAVALVLAYFGWPAAQPVFHFFTDLKMRYGLIYSLLATSIFGGIIPFLLLRMTGQIHDNAGRQFIFYTVLWAAKGIEVDLFYTLQNHLFGSGHDLATIISKTLVDQFIYVVFWAAPCLTLVFLWKDQDFSLSRTRQKLNRKFFILQIPTIIISNWLIWIPAVSMIYLMPPSLQIPMFNLVLCFFVLLLAFLSQKPKAPKF